MRYRRLTLLATLAVLAALTISSVAFASYSTTFIYTKFNSTDTTVEELDQTYADIDALIYNKLTYNSSASGEVKIILANTTEAAKCGIMITMKKAGANNLLVYWKDGDTDVQIGLATWEADDVVEVQVSSDVLTVDLYSNSTDEWTNIIDNFHASSIDYAAVCVTGSGTGTVTAGYVSVVITSSGGSYSSTTDAVTGWLPTLVSFAMLGVAIGFIKKFS